MKANRKKLLIITGPTGVGKTDLSIEIGLLHSFPIISCDSRQFYREMSIGTAKPEDEILKKVPHYFINSLSIEDDFSAGDFEREGLGLLKEIYKSKDAALLVGGSGLYIKALCEGFDQFPDIPLEIIDSYKKLLQTEGIESLQEILKTKDLDYYNQVDLNNPHRLIRALSVITSSGKPFSSFLNQKKQVRNFDCIYIVINRNREELYNRINSRVENMFDSGLLKEVEFLTAHKEKNALQTVGYKEVFDFIDGKISLERAKELIKRNTRRYAKRQLTWFKGIENAKWFQADNMEEILNYVNEIVGE